MRVILVLIKDLVDLIVCGLIDTLHASSHIKALIHLCDLDLV